MHVLSGAISHCLCKSVLLHNNWRPTEVFRVCVLSVHAALFLGFSSVLIRDANERAIEWMNEWKPKRISSGTKCIFDQNFNPMMIEFYYFRTILCELHSSRLRWVLSVLANRRKFKFPHLHVILMHHWNVLTDPLPHRTRIKTFECTSCVDLKVG